MTKRSPFSSLRDGLDRFASGLKPPAPVVREVQRRLVLFLNHVIAQEPEAQKRLRRLEGRVVRAEWRDFWLQLVVTPAGLLDLAPVTEHDLLLTVIARSPFDLARGALRGDRPEVRIEGNADLAGEINWLIANLRWDVEEDLAQVVGDAPAHALGEVGRAVAAALRRFTGAGGGRDKAEP